MKQIVKLLTLMCRKAHLPAFALMALLSGLAAHADVVINETTFPDANFRNFILSQSYGQDGVLTDAEIADVHLIDCSKKNIASLKGIEYFISLDNLYCYDNLLTTLDISNNILLISLDCRLNQLSELDISNNSELQSLSCGSNQITALDVSNNVQLSDLECQANQLTAIDLSKNTKLAILSCGNNSFTALDVSNNVALYYFRCQYNRLTTLDVSKNIALRDLDCSHNQLTALDVSRNSELEYLQCDNNQLTALDVSKNTALQLLFCDVNPLGVLDISQNTILQNLGCSSNQLTTLDVKENTKLVQIVCHNNQLTALDVSKNTVLENLSCNNNLLTTLDVSKNTDLKHLKCWNNELTTLNLRNNIAIEELFCHNNKLTELDLSNNTALNNLNYPGQTRELIAQSAVTPDGENFYYFRLDDNTDNDQPIWARMTETNFGGVESKFDPTRVLEWTHGGMVIEGQKRVATTVDDVNPQNVTGKILLLTNAIENPATNTASGSVNYKYNVNNSVDPDGSKGSFILNWTAPIPSNPHTAVTDLHQGREAVGVTYTNLAGQSSDKPFDGINIVTTRYSDGTTNATKIIK